ncbi:AraC family transcriptional regulator [Lonsdalea britannica]|uniref:AraC family transcriptional regulator n=1 Tax=Lonsdalea britannica TaxID=1082704 RepID=UPI000A23734E|nr:AraC family transcriptional regulator [Lonsdalea britannica]OSM95532.1 AraC family transcriptional regulator [Lonsdalea britannica]
MFRKTVKNDWVKLATPSDKFERLEAFFTGHGYDPHRHDTYAIGRTLSGIQSFKYRGSRRQSLAGHTMVLHPDEIHDGEAGTADGFHYRMIYIEPSSIQKILGGQPLPFIQGGTSTDPRLITATESLLRGMDNTFDSLEEDDAIYELAHALSAVGGQKIIRRSYDYPAAERAREYIDDLFTETVTLDALSIVSGRDRWNLSRDFRMLYGTSPYRYVTLRRLEYCRKLMLTGENLANIAVTAGFSDQSHMTRHFIKAFGISPGMWLKIINKQRI